MSRSNKPKVLGLVSISAATRLESFDSRSARLILPSGPEATSTTSKQLREALAARVVVGVDHSKRGPLAVGACRRLERDPIDSDHGAQSLLEAPHQFQGSLDGVLILVVFVRGESRQRRGHLVGDRVVLHRAAAERIELLADGVVHRGELAVVAHGLGLAGPWEGGRFRPEKLVGQEIRGPCARHARVRQAGRVHVRPALFEAEGFGHWLTASTSSSIALGSLTSVQVKVSTPLSSRNHRCTSSPPRMPLRASLRFTTAPFGARIGNSLRNGRSGKASSHPRSAASLSASACARLKLTSATWRMPSAPI